MVLAEEHAMVIKVVIAITVLLVTTIGVTRSIRAADCAPTPVPGCHFASLQ